MLDLRNYTREEFIVAFRKAKLRKREWENKVDKELAEFEENLKLTRNNVGII